MSRGRSRAGPSRASSSFKESALALACQQIAAAAAVSQETAALAMALGDAAAQPVRGYRDLVALVCYYHCHRHQFVLIIFYGASSQASSGPAWENSANLRPHYLEGLRGFRSPLGDLRSQHNTNCEANSRSPRASLESQSHQAVCLFTNEVIVCCPHSPHCPPIVWFAPLASVRQGPRPALQTSKVCCESSTISNPQRLNSSLEVNLKQLQPGALALKFNSSNSKQI